MKTVLGGDVLTIVRSSMIKKFEKNQNNCLWLITGIVKTTLISAIHSLTNIQSLKIEYKCRASTYMTKL